MKHGSPVWQKSKENIVIAPQVDTVAPEDKPHYHTRSEGGITVSGDCCDFVCLFVCQFVCQRDNSWTVRDIITKFSGHHSISERVDKFENGYTRVRGWWFNVSGVLASKCVGAVIYRKSIVYKLIKGGDQKTVKTSGRRSRDVANGMVLLYIFVSRRRVANVGC